MVKNILVEVDLLDSLVVDAPYLTIPRYSWKYDPLGTVFMEDIGDGYVVHYKDPRAVIQCIHSNTSVTIEQLAKLPPSVSITVPSCNYELRINRPISGTYCDVTLAIINSHKLYLNYICNS